jgi:hypothetical protein
LGGQRTQAAGYPGVAVSALKMLACVVGCDLAGGGSAGVSQSVHMLYAYHCLAVAEEHGMVVAVRFSKEEDEYTCITVYRK